MTMPLPLPPSDELLGAFTARFVNRRHPYAVQQEDGTYRWRYEDLTSAMVRAHLGGELTLALSSSDEAGNCRWLCLDVDSAEGLQQLLALRVALNDIGLRGLVEASRRGGHLWLFLDAPTQVVAARTMLVATLDRLRTLGIDVPECELYPDIGAADHAGLGHAVRLPLGIHRLSGRRYDLFDEDDLPCAFTSIEAALRFVLTRQAIAELSAGQIIYLPEPAIPASNHDHDQDMNGAEAVLTVMADTPQLTTSGRVGTRSPVIRWVDANVSPLDLLAQLAPDTELKCVGRGYLGWCPFHDDRDQDGQGKQGTPSFYVVRDRRYGWSWRCLSTNCEQHEGLMRHSFRLFQELTGLSVASAVVEALSWWPEADVPRGDDRRVVQRDQRDQAEKRDQAERSGDNGLEDPTSR